MSAKDTAIRVLDWAIAGTGPAPEGDLRSCDELALPPTDLRGKIQLLCRRTCAALRWQVPPLGDARPVGMDILILAAAIGYRNAKPPFSRLLLTGVPVANSPAEWALRHGLVARAIEYVPDLTPGLEADLRSLSPLTALLDHAGLAQAPEARAIAGTLRNHPDGRRSLIQTVAQPTASYLVRQWRTELLERWRVGDPDEQRLVLEIYEALLVFHERQILDQVREAANTIRTSSSQERMQEAISVGRFWRPLALIQRNQSALLRSLRHLKTSYRRGLELCRETSRLLGEPL